MIYTTPACVGCGETTDVEVDLVAFDDWRNGRLIQAAFPALSDEERELLISGTHPACWLEIFGEEE